MKTTTRLVLILALAGIVAGCETFTPPGRDENAVPNRLHYFSTRHWPYQDCLPFVKIPAQFTAGLPFFPCMLGLMPYAVAVQEKTDFGMAFLDAETIYMETPGYIIYRSVGFPFYCVQYALVDQPMALYKDWRRGSVAEEDDGADSDAHE